MMATALEIKSTITTETVNFSHYPQSREDQLHIHIRHGLGGRSIFLTKCHAQAIRDFMNEHYPENSC